MSASLHTGLRVVYCSPNKSKSAKISSLPVKKEIKIMDKQKTHNKIGLLLIKNKPASASLTLQSCASQKV